MSHRFVLDYAVVAEKHIFRNAIAKLPCLQSTGKIKTEKSNMSNMFGRFRKKSGRFTSKKMHDKVNKFVQRISDSWVRRRDPEVTENIEMVRLDHSYWSPRNQANDHDSDQHSIADVASEETIGQDSDDEIDLSWREGRGVVELGVLSDELAGCKMCSQPLILQNCVGEKRYGLRTLLYVICDTVMLTQEQISSWEMQPVRKPKTWRSSLGHKLQSGKGWD